MAISSRVSTSELQLSLFTAAEIAAVLGRKRQSVARQLKEITESAVVAVRGNEAKAWKYSDLPNELKLTLSTQATKRGYDHPCRMLAAPPPRWEPDIPLSEIAEKYLVKARRLQAALAYLLERLERRPFPELLTQTRTEYLREFGREVSEAHLRILIERTIDRDRGACEWNRLALYLDDRIARKSCHSSKAERYDLVHIRAALSFLTDPGSPQTGEIPLVWNAIFSGFEILMAETERPRSLKRAVIDLLRVEAPWLAKNRSTLERQFARKYDRWIQGGRTATCLCDLRPAKAGRKAVYQLDEKTLGLLQARSLNDRGRLGQAWRELWDEGKLPEELYNQGSRGRVPDRIRTSLTAQIRAMRPHFQGPRHAKVNGPKVERDWSGLPSGYQVQADDVTWNHFYWVPDENGEHRYGDLRFRIIRGQCLLWIDSRTTYIHCFQLIPREQYTSLDILRGVIHLHDSWGLPPELLFELGLWERSLVIKGRNDELGLKERIYGLEDLGVRIRHAYDPSAKVVEGVFGRLQNSMDKERGYSGRNERFDLPESTKEALKMVRSGKVHPAEYFLSHAEWTSRLEQICDDYNDTPQNGKMLRGLAPRAAFRRWQMDTPPVRLDGPLRYLLAMHCREVKVRERGIVLKIGRREYVYRDQSTSDLIGTKVLAWWDQESPEQIVLTTLDHKNPVVVDRATLVPAFDAPTEVIAQAKREISEHLSGPKSRLSSLRKKFPEEFANRGRRKVDWNHEGTREAAELGQEIEHLQGEAKLEREEKDRSRRRLSRLAAESNFYIPSSSEATGGQLKSAEKLRLLSKKRAQQNEESRR